MLPFISVKNRAEGIYRVYDIGMNSKASELFALQNNLRHALERNEFVLYYQPQINLQTGKLTGLEALIRWQHPEQGLVSPATFIPLAEESDLIVHIGKWVLEVACKQAVEWQRATGIPLSISVNLSTRSILRTNSSGDHCPSLTTNPVRPQIFGARDYRNDCHQ